MPNNFWYWVRRAVFFVFFTPGLCNPATLQAQSQTLVSFCLFCPNAEIMILNATSDGSLVMPEVGSKRGPILYEARHWSVRFSSLTTGDLPITIDVCTSTKPLEGLNFPPAWTMNTAQLGNLALTSDYLSSENLSENDLKRRIDLIKKSLRGRLGEKAKEKELSDWFKQVKKGGVKIAGNSCSSPVVLPAMTMSWYYWNYYGGPRVTEVVIKGSRSSGYRIDRPTYVY